VNLPKRHHYVPETILKRFTDEEGWLHLYSRREGRVRRTRPRNAFCEGHLYSEVDDEGRKDPRVELELSWLETVIDPILTKFEDSARTGRLPNLTSSELLTWRFFFIVQWRRVPDLHQTVATDQEAEAELRQILDELEKRYPDRISEIEEFRDASEMKRTIRNARIRGVPEVSERVMNALQERGVAVLSITAPTKSLIIASRPVVQLAFRDGLTLMDEATEMWLPISSRVAVGVGPRNQRETIYYLNNHAAIRHLNLAVAQQSSEFASRSPQLTTSIAQAR
jgi:hypothetical protein